MNEKTKYFFVNKAANKAEILIYGYIDQYDVGANAFVKELRQLEKEYEKIDVRINSGGGSVFEGITIYNAIKNSSAHIDTYIDGFAASMASIIALAGKTVHMSRNASMMTHKPSTFASGTSEDLVRNAKLLDEIEITGAQIYADKTGKTIDEAKTAYMNGKDNWFTAQQALDEKLVDAIYDMPEVKAPAKARTEILAYEEYAMQLDPLISPNPQQTNNNIMKEVKFTPEMVAALGLQPTASAEDITSAFTALQAKAAKADKAEADLVTMQAAKVQAETDLENYKLAAAKEEATALLAAKVTDGSITQEQSNLFAVQFENNLPGLKAVLATMKPYQSVVAQINTEGSAGELAELVKMSGKELFMTGKFDRLKALNEEAFKAKWKEYVESV